MHVSSSTSTTIPIDNQAPLVEQHAQLASHYPLVVGEAFAPHLVGCPLVSPRVQDLYAVGVDHSQQSRFSHEVSRPLLVSSKQAEKTSTLRQSRKQRQAVTLGPAVEGSITNTLDGEQQSQCHHLTWIQTRLVVLGNVLHNVIYSAKQFDDKILGRHRASPWLWSRQQQLGKALCFCQSSTSTIG